jgi:hypothetical protein
MLTSRTMVFKSNVLVVANVTASSDDLVAALTRLARRGPTRFTLLVPATHFGGGRAAAQASLDEALERLSSAGLDAEGRLGDADPCLAVSEAWDPKEFDEIVVCTLPLGSSVWLHAGLPERIGRLTGGPVTHVVAHPRPPAPAAEPAEPAEAGAQSPEPLGPLLAPFAVLDHVEEHERRRRGRL